MMNTQEMDYIGQNVFKRTLNALILKGMELNKLLIQKLGLISSKTQFHPIIKNSKRVKMIKLNYMPNQYGTTLINFAINGVHKTLLCVKLINKKMLINIGLEPAV